MFFQFQATLGGGISSSSPGSPRSPSSAGASSAWVGNSQKLKALQSQVLIQNHYATWLCSAFSFWLFPTHAEEAPADDGERGESGDEELMPPPNVAWNWKKHVSSYIQPSSEQDETFCSQADGFRSLPGKSDHFFVEGELLLLLSSLFFAQQSAGIWFIWIGLSRLEGDLLETGDVVHGCSWWNRTFFHQKGLGPDLAPKVHRSAPF